MGVHSLHSPREDVKNPRMKVILVACLVGLSVAAPGGYTGIGGVYKNMNQKADYMSHAKKASQMALDLFNDESLLLEAGERPARNTEVYVPSFFTNQPQPAAAQALPQHVRPVRESQYYKLPIYYTEYRPRPNQ